MLMTKIVNRLNELRNRDKNWLGPGSVPPSDEGLTWLIQQFERYYPGDLPIPYLCPTENNGICAEWPIGSNEASVDFSLATHQGEWIGFSDDDADIRGLDFDTPQAWTWLVEQIRLMESLASVTAY